MAEDIERLQRQRAQAEAANDAAAAARFDQRIHLASRQQQQGPAVNPQDQAAAEARDVNPMIDIARGLLTGGRSAIEGIPAMPQDIANLGAAGFNWATGGEQNWDIPFLPSSDEVNQATSKYIGPSYEPQTRGGRYARSIGENLPAFINPLAGGRKAIMEIGEAIVGGAASEYAGEKTAGTKWEPAARMAAGVGGSVAPAAVGGVVEGAVTAPGRKREALAEDAALQHGVRLTKGERTGDVNQQMQEQEMLKGQHGPTVQQALDMRRQESLSKIKEAGVGMSDQMAPSRGTNAAQSGGLLNDQTRTRAEDLMTRGGKSIEDAINEGVIVDTERLKGLPGELQSKLTGPDPYIPDVAIDANTPIAQKALGSVQQAIKKYEDNPDLVDESLGTVERLRRQIGGMKATTPEDARALAKVKQHFDDWYDDTIANDAAVVPSPGSSQYNLPGQGSGKTPEQILDDLRGGRSTFKEGADIARPRDKDRGSKEVAKIADEGAIAEDTARLFRPRDNGEISSAAIKTVQRLKKVGATEQDLDQVRGIILETLTNGDPGKLNTRINNFIERNPTAVAELFTPEQVQKMRDYAGTNKRLVPDPKAINPPQSGYGPARAITKQGAKAAGDAKGLIGAVIGSTIDTGTSVAAAIGGKLLGTAKGVWDEAQMRNKANRALDPVDRRSPARIGAGDAGKAAGKSIPGALQAGQTITINTDENDPNFGKQARIISVGKDGYKVRLPNGKTEVLGHRLVEPVED